MSDEILSYRIHQTNSPFVTVIKPTRNAVVIQLVEHQLPDGTIERSPVIYVECKDNHLERELVSIAQSIRL